ncbi:altronate oxidoreductase [Paenibacillus albidus]|uniref:Altronate oxidoreductase n=1 Tax=Paenibacillus albidus TaxID=2041023 RepID=A0A917BZR4_9BACL|nr:tagaturonate reductase [Paenibacillus albidus]GGF61064.1 altronate oxidoreductase [Paenibacillus albidus]
MSKPVPEQHLNLSILKGGKRQSAEHIRQNPVKILQIGEGNFLRGFFDWMINECCKQENYQGSIAVSQPRPSGSAKLAKLKEQDGLYTQITRGLEQGKPVERSEVIPVISRTIDPYTEWEEWLSLGVSSELQVIVSNTTEAGLRYHPEELQEGIPVLSFPGKLAVLLYRRFQAVAGDPGKGLLILPLELLERNGDELKRLVLQYSRDWRFPEDFIQWVERHNRFLNSLVDRIVTGYPEEEAEAWFAELGYRDRMLNAAEPYHFWAIEGEPELDEQLPLRKSGLNVHWVQDLKPYQLRKVRILNGAHTLMTPLALLHGLGHVREVMEHSEFRAFTTGAVEQEIIPVMGMDAGELLHYAESVYERFSNPFIRHNLADIAMNSLSKFRVRLLPSLEAYVEQGKGLPERLVQSLGGLLRYCRVRETEGRYEGTTLRGEPYQVRDDPALLGICAEAWEAGGMEERLLADTVDRLLCNEDLWGRDLTLVEGLAGKVTAYLEELDRH